MFVHGLHFKTFTERNPSHTLSPATPSDEREWGVRYALSVPQLIQAMCSDTMWKSSVVINLTLLEAHANAGRSVRFCRSTTFWSFVCAYVCLSRVFGLTHVLLMMRTAGECEGETKTNFNIDEMQAASPLWIRQLLAKVISKNIELAVNQGGKQRKVAVSAT